jgi:hypothetical protein
MHGSDHHRKKRMALVSHEGDHVNRLTLGQTKGMKKRNGGRQQWMSHGTAAVKGNC